MRAHHTTHALPAFPVYSAAFVADNRLVLGGGGGASRSGIKNKLRLYAIPNDEILELLDELELERGEDAPMSMAAKPESSQLICGVNSTMAQLEIGINKNCRIFTVDSNKKLQAGPSTNTLRVKPDNLDDYQKVTALSPDFRLLVAGGTYDFAILSYPSLAPVVSVQTTPHEIYDATFSSSTLVVATTQSLLVYVRPSASASTESKGKGKKKQNAPSALSLPLELIKTLERPALPGGDAGTFRAARYLPGSDKTLYTVVNTTPPRVRGKSVPKRGYVCKWDTDSWDAPKIRKAGEKGITCFDVSPNGKFLAFGSADYTIGLLDAQTLAPLLTILKAHDFPPTILRFNPTSSLLVSGSADNSIRAVTVPTSVGGSSWNVLTIILITVFIIVLAILVQVMFGAGNSKVW